MNRFTQPAQLSTEELIRKLAAEARVYFRPEGTLLLEEAFKRLRNGTGGVAELADAPTPRPVTGTAGAALELV